MPASLRTTSHCAARPISPTCSKSFTMSKGTFSYMLCTIVLSMPVVVSV